MDDIGQVVPLLNTAALAVLLALFVSGRVVARDTIVDIARSVAREILLEMARDDRVRARVRRFAGRTPAEPRDEGQ